MIGFFYAILWAVGLPQYLPFCQKLTNRHKIQFSYSFFSQKKIVKTIMVIVIHKE